MMKKRPETKIDPPPVKDTQNYYSRLCQPALLAPGPVGRDGVDHTRQDDREPNVAVEVTPEVQGDQLNTAVFF